MCARYQARPRLPEGSGDDGAFGTCLQRSVRKPPSSLDYNDAEGAAIAKFTFTYTQPGVYAPRLTVSDTDGHVYTAVTVVHVADPTAMDARLQPVWQGVKDALRVGDVTGAAAFIHSDTRDTYQTAWSQLSLDVLSNGDQIMTQIQLADVGPGGAEYEMRRDKNGQTFSYPAWFQLDQDGLWRLLRSSCLPVACPGRTPTQKVGGGDFGYRSRYRPA